MTESLGLSVQIGLCPIGNREVIQVQVVILVHVELKTRDNSAMIPYKFQGGRFFT